MSGLADLHIHTYYSDSTSSPEEVVEQARQNGLNCIAIVDHDTIDGIEPTLRAASAYGLEVVPGIELSSEINGKDVHILGYFIDCKNEYFSARVKQMQGSRIGRMEEMIAKLRQLGVDNIKLEEVAALAKSDSLGRPHLAKVLVEKGVVADVRQAFDRYLSEKGPAYVSKFKQTPYEAIQLIREAGGVAVLAHPLITAVDELIPGFVQGGLGGIEVYYPNCSNNIIHFYEGIAQKHGLAVTGGSDAHGEAKRHTFIGRIKIPYELVEKLRQAVKGQG